MFHPKPARPEIVFSPGTWFSHLFASILSVLSILTSAAVGNVHISFALWSWLWVRIRLENCVCRCWVLAIAWLGAHRGEPAPVPAGLVPALGWGHLLLSPGPCCTLSSCSAAGALLGNKGNHAIGASEKLIFPLLFLQGMEEDVEGKEAESHFHLKVSLTNLPGNGWGCYNHFVGLQSPALNLEGTFLLGSSNTFCLSLLSIWQLLWLRDSSLLIIPGSSILNFYGLCFAAPEPQYITCTKAVEWELQQSWMSFSKWII